MPSKSTLLRDGRPGSRFAVVFAAVASFSLWAGAFRSGDSNTQCFPFSTQVLEAAENAEASPPAADTPSPAPRPPALGRTEIGSEAWRPPTDPTPKVIYGDDDRIDLYEETDETRRQLAKSVSGLISAWRVDDNGDGTYSLQTAAYRVGGLPPCDGEPFADQPVAAFCTGFLVDDDLIATAGHCYDDGDLAGVFFVFGFVMADATEPVTTVDADQVYEGVEVVGRQYTNDFDYAVVRVDRTVTAPDAQPLGIRRDGVVAVGAQVGVIGHPAGLPLKLAFGAQTMVKANTAVGYFSANLDTYGGNSGSPVFDAATGLVEGILVRGQSDWVFEVDCFRSNELSDDYPFVEEVSKATTFAQHVPNGGCVAPDISTDPEEKLKFRARIGNCKQKTVTISNEGDCALSISAVTPSKAKFTVVSPSFPNTVPAGSQLNVLVEFCPQKKRRVKAKLIITSDDPDTPELKIKLRGKGRK